MKYLLMLLVLLVPLASSAQEVPYPDDGRFYRIDMRFSLRPLGEAPNSYLGCLQWDTQFDIPAMRVSMPGCIGYTVGRSVRFAGGVNGRHELLGTAAEQSWKRVSGGLYIEGLLGFDLRLNGNIDGTISGGVGIDEEASLTLDEDGRSVSTEVNLGLINTNADFEANFTMGDPIGFTAIVGAGTYFRVGPIFVEAGVCYDSALHRRRPAACVTTAIRFRRD